jgi:hypothetical protein
MQTPATIEAPKRVLIIQQSNLAIQRAYEKSQHSCFAIAENQMKALESALRAEIVRALEQNIQSGMFDVRNLSKEHSVLKLKFVKHCSIQQDYKSAMHAGGDMLLVSTTSIVILMSVWIHRLH